MTQICSSDSGRKSLEDDLIIEIEENHDQHILKNISPNRDENNVNKQVSQIYIKTNQTSKHTNTSQTDSGIADWIEKNSNGL